MLTPARSLLRSAISRRPSSVAAYAPPSRGLCRLMLRTGSEATPAVDQDAFDEQMKAIKGARGVHDAAIENKAPAPAKDATKDMKTGSAASADSELPLYPDSEASVLELKKQARAAAEENRGFEDGLKGVNPLVLKDEGKDKKRASA